MANPFLVNFPVLYSLIAWKVPKYEIFSGPYFPVFGLNTEIYFIKFPYSVRIKENTVQKKLRI